jgi:hypothetical protein
MLEVLSFLAAGVWRDIIVAPFVFLVFILAGIVFTKYILKAVLKVSQKAELDKKILLALDPPLRVVFIFP